MSSKLFLIGLGHRARSGKDTVANFITQKKKNVIIYHFADPLKEEVMNKNRKIPLIYRERSKFSEQYWYNIWSHDNEYRTIVDSRLPFLHKIFEDRKIHVYWGMDGNGNDEKKDSLMLQFWGTNWRRHKFADNYWIQKVEDYFKENFYNKQFSGDAYFLLPDVRFRNEVAWIKSMDNEILTSFYVKVVRYNENATIYYDLNRDPNHPSEVDLEGIEPDCLIEAKSGDMKSLLKQTDELIKYFESII
jgi:hypothetical protein